jgi:hypothetical protein
MPNERISIFVDAGPYDSVVVRRDGFAFTVVTAEPPKPPKEPWVPGKIPPPWKGLRVTRSDEWIDEVMGWSSSDYDLDVLHDRAAPRPTITITIDGTNFVDFDNSDLRRQLDDAIEIGADVVIRLAE